MSDSLFIGIDGGGSKTLAHAAIGPVGPAVTVHGPAAQALRDGPAAAADVVAGLIAQARAAFEGAPVGGVVVGLAGAGQASVREQLAGALATSLDDAPLVVVHDAEIAHRAAWGEGSGAILIVGTGSLVYAKTEAGEALRAGGWGASLGDDGGGAALGRAALRGLLAALDGGPPSALPEIAADRFALASAADVMAAVYAAPTPLATFAPLLLAAVEAGDWTAEAALRAEVNALGKQAGWLATRAGDTVAHRLATTGGLTTEAVYRSALDDALARHLPGWDVSQLEAEPAEGALAMARALGT